MKTQPTHQTPAPNTAQGHTPVPYYVEQPYGEPGIYIASTVNTGLIAKIYPQDRHLFNKDKQVTDLETASFIVRACNSHAALVAALDAALSQCRHYGPTSRAELGGEHAVDVLEQGAAALALAKGGAQ